jgi:transposase-like protein
MSLTSRRTAMARKRYKPEEIVAKLRQVDVLVSQGQNMVDAIRQIGVSEVTYYRWRQEFGGQGTAEPSGSCAGGGFSVKLSSMRMPFGRDLQPLALSSRAEGLLGDR